jgi:hypothetical protein
MAATLYKSEPPKYKGCDAKAGKGSGGVSGLLCNLFGSVTPDYNCPGAKADSSRCWYQLFPPTPDYREAPPIIDPGPGDGSDCHCEPHQDVMCVEPLPPVD